MSREKEDVERPSFMDLPYQVSLEIFSLLPIKTLLRCKSVCSTWKTLISDPAFVKLHHQKTHVHLLHLDYKKNDSSCFTHLIDLRGVGETTICSQADDTVKFKGFQLDGSIYDRIISCNGLVCIENRITGLPAYVFNPITGEYITLPHPIWDGYVRSKDVRYHRGFHFGFCPDTSQYKVVRIIDSHGNHNITEIYELGEGKWRPSIGHTPNSFHKPIRVSGCEALFLCQVATAFVNGVVYSFDKDLDVDYVRGFHFGREEWIRISTPDELNSLKLDKYKIERTIYERVNLAELQGCLNLIYSDVDSRRLIFWELSKTSNWTKRFVIDVSLFPPKLFCKPITMLANGDMIMELKYKHCAVPIALYSARCQSFRSFNKMYEFNGNYFGAVQVQHIASLISLRDVAKGEVSKSIIGVAGGGIVGVDGGMLSAPYDMSMLREVHVSMPVAALASQLAISSPDQQRMMLGEALYPLVEQLQRESAANVTGMLLVMDQIEVLHLLESPEALKARVEEAMEVLQYTAQHN